LRFNDGRKIKIDVTHRKNNKNLKFVSGNFRVSQRYEAKGKIVEKLSNPLRSKSGRLIFSEIMKPTVLRKTNGNLRIFLH